MLVQYKINFFIKSQAAKWYHGRVSFFFFFFSLSLFFFHTRGRWSGSPVSLCLSVNALYVYICMHTHIYIYNIVQDYVIVGTVVNGWLSFECVSISLIHHEADTWLRAIMNNEIEFIYVLYCVIICMGFSCIVILVLFFFFLSIYTANLLNLNKRFAIINASFISTIDF